MRTTTRTRCLRPGPPGGRPRPRPQISAPCWVERGGESPVPPGCVRAPGAHTRRPRERRVEEMSERGREFSLSSSHISFLPRHKHTQPMLLTASTSGARASAYTSRARAPPSARPSVGGVVLPPRPTLSIARSLKADVGVDSIHDWRGKQMQEAIDTYFTELWSKVIPHGGRVSHERAEFSHGFACFFYSQPRLALDPTIPVIQPNDPASASPSLPAGTPHTMHTPSLSSFCSHLSPRVKRRPPTPSWPTTRFILMKSGAAVPTRSSRGGPPLRPSSPASGRPTQTFGWRLTRTVSAGRTACSCGGRARRLT